MKFQIVDAFTENLFGGNPAGVVLLDDNADFPTDDVMVKTAAELRYSETAFIKKLSADNFHIRYFTPAAEVDLCGHATIGSFAALKNWGLATDGNKYTINTLAGTLEIELKDGKIFMQMGEAQIIKTIESDAQISEIAKIMGISASDIIKPVNIVTTGLADIMLEVSSREVLSKISPDFPALSEISKNYNVTGLHAAYFANTGEARAYCRNFAPLYDIDEEAATGTSNGALTYHFYSQQRISAGSVNNFVQGEAMGRPSKITSLLTETDGKIKILIGGNAVTLATGEINL